MKYTEIDQNRIIILQKTCNNGALHQTHSQTHRQTEIHTFFIWYPRVGREHNSPSGKKWKNNICTRNYNYRGGGKNTPPLRSKSGNFENGVLFLPKNLRIRWFCQNFGGYLDPFWPSFSRFPLAMRSKTLKIFWRASRANFKFSARGFIFAKNLMNFWRGSILPGNQ